QRGFRACRCSAIGREEWRVPARRLSQVKRVLIRPAGHAKRKSREGWDGSGDAGIAGRQDAAVDMRHGRVARQAAERDADVKRVRRRVDVDETGPRSRGLIAWVFVLAIQGDDVADCCVTGGGDHEHCGYEGERRCHTLHVKSSCSSVGPPAEPPGSIESIPEHWSKLCWCGCPRGGMGFALREGRSRNLPTER